MPTPRLRLGQLLVDAKMITEEDLQAVLSLQKSLQASSQGTEGRRLGTLLVERGLINETQLTQILSHQLSIPWVSLLHIEFSRQLLNLVPHDVADRYCLVPIYVRHVRNQGETLYVAMDDPTNEDGLRACREHSGLPVRAMIAPPSDIRSAIRVYYGVTGVSVRPPPEQVETEAPPPPSREPISTEGLDIGARITMPEVRMRVEYRPLQEDLEEPEPRPRSEAPPSAPVEDPAAEEPVAEESTEEPTEEEPVYARFVSEAPSIQVEDDSPVIEVNAPPPSSWRGGRTPVERLRSILQTDAPPPSSTREVEIIPKPRGRAPRMVTLTLLDGMTINLPAAKRSRRAELSDADDEAPAPAPRPRAAKRAPAPAPAPSRAPAPANPDDPDALGLTARDLVLALRAVAHGADASEVLGSSVRWEPMFAALLSLMMKKHLIADWEFVEEFKKKL